jgi:type II secretory pathway pseudopilin PulG
MRRRLVARVGSSAAEGGYSLIELIAVAVILVIVLGGLTTVFVAGSKSQLELNRRFEAQQNARLALDKIRRELHCASGITATEGTPVASITVTLPGSCPSAGGVDQTIVYDTQLVAANRYELRRNSVRVADYLTQANVFTYTAPSATSLGKLHVDFPVNVYPSEGWKQWRLVDDIVMRNTVRTG